jgi:hypothetical protein
MMVARLLGSTAVAVALALLPACAWEATTTPFIGGYATVYASTVPANIEVYPRVWYSDRYVYLVGDRWYAPAGRRWVMLRNEPPPLFRYRTAFRAAPPPPAAVRPSPPPPRWAPPPPRFGYPRPQPQPWSRPQPSPRW